jgi:hypothetical protein
MQSCVPLCYLGDCVRIRATRKSASEGSQLPAIGNIDRTAWRFRHSAPLTFGFQNSGESNAAIQLLSTIQTTRSFLGQLFHGLAVPIMGDFF